MRAFSLMLNFVPVGLEPVWQAHSVSSAAGRWSRSIRSTAIPVEEVSEDNDRCQKHRTSR